uniref:Senescence-associated family protein n=1 Tax=Rhizophora mucronata TaxID=61149 RepID=A0A2P2L0Q9_RHIMU
MVKISGSCSCLGSVHWAQIGKPTIIGWLAAKSKNPSQK